jgi:hypothetical protein
MIDGARGTMRILLTEAQPSDALKNLVLSIIVLAVLGTIIAVAWLFGVQLPAQVLAEAPKNAVV